MIKKKKKKTSIATQTFSIFALNRTIIAMKINKLILSIALTMMFVSLYAQSTVGKDFWVTFLPNYEYVKYTNMTNNLALIVTSKCPCSGMVTNPNTHWSTTFEVEPGSSTTVPIPMEGNYINTPTGLQEISDCILNHGLHVVTTDSVSLYASNFTRYADGSFDATCVLTTQSLGDTYIIQTCKAIQSSRYDFNEFSIIAVENNTVVDINLTDKAFGQEANTPFSVTLQAGQCYQIISTSCYVTERDFSGTYIKARNGKRIAVFAGNNCANLFFQDDIGANHLYEQMLPVSSWGKLFIVGGSMGSKGVVHITASHDHCEIKRNGVPVDTIQAMQTYEYEITSSPLADFLETSEPAQVCLFITRLFAKVTTNIDVYPAMVLISPLEQRIKEVTFTTFNYELPFTPEGCIEKHYVNIVTETQWVQSMTLDGNDISTQFHSVPYDNRYSYARIQIQHGTHTLSNYAGGIHEGGFIAYVYGMGSYTAANIGGCYAYSAGCQVINQTSQIMVDEQYSTGFANGFWFCEEDTVNFSLFTNFVVSRADWRFGDDASGTGPEVAHHYPRVGNYNVSCDVYTMSSQGQDSLINTLTTKIHIQQPTEQDVYNSDCDSHIWNGEIYTESGIYTYHGHSLGGCDSIVNMYLTLHPTVTIPYDTTFCNQYEWHDSIYTLSGVYTHLEGQTSFGCDSIALLNLTIEQAPPFQIAGYTQVACVTDFWPGSYYYYAIDSTALGSEVIHWTCSRPDWIILPKSDFSCELIITTLGSGTLTATITSGCEASQTIVLNATPYGIDENQNDQITLFPNPAQSFISLESSLSLHQVTLLNLLGQIIKELSYSPTYQTRIDVADLPEGAYLMQIETNYGTIAKLLMISR